MNKKVVIIIAVVAVLAIAIVLGVMFGMKLTGGEGEDSKVDILSEEVVQIEVGEMYSNISGSKKVAKLNMTLAVKDGDTVELINNKMAIVRDEINKIVRGKSEEDIRGTEGQVQLKNDIVKKLTEIFKTDDIVDLYFNEMIIQ